MAIRDFDLKPNASLVKYCSNEDSIRRVKAATSRPKFQIINGITPQKRKKVLSDRLKKLAVLLNSFMGEPRREIK